MPNPIKYSTTSQTLALKKGNFWIGTGDVGKGTTGATDYYNGITPPSGGYTIYLNKATGGPQIHTAANDTQLITLTNIIASANYTTAAQCLEYFAGQTDKIVFNRDYESIVTDGLVLNVDAGFTPSYPKSNTSWYDVSSNSFTGTLTNGPSFDSNNGGYIVFDGSNDYVTLGDQSALAFTNGIFSAESWIYIPSTWTGGTQYPNLISKGATAGWDTNGWSQFVFRDWNGPYAWGYGARNGGSVNIVSRGSCPSNAWLNIVVTADGSTIRLYENASEINNGTQTVNPASNTTPVYIGADVNLQCFNGRVAICRLYNKKLSSSEITQNFNAVKSRFGL
jgi:hypothetical protein